MNQHTYRYMKQFSALGLSELIFKQYAFEYGEQKADEIGYVVKNFPIFNEFIEGKLLSNEAPTASELESFMIKSNYFALAK